jgi:carbon-monoxide dehydrogenase large subunit
MSHAYGSLPRKEDPRFIKGQGTFIDDVALPGMLHGAILRSPLAHARIVSVDATAARAHPLVVTVLTGADLAERGLAWMPTLFGDVQSVLATDKVRFQGQEIAFVVATDRYAARDALELIAVDYEPLPPLMDALTALEPGAPAVREDRPGGNRVFDWSAGDKAAADAAFAAADVVVECDMLYPRSHPAPLETCGAIAEYDATVTGLPEHKIRIVSPDLGGGFGAKVPLYPGYVCAIAAAMETGHPVKWVEDRSESLMSTAFARDYHMHGEIAATADGEILGLRARVLADHGAFNAAAQPSKFPAGFFHIFTGSYRVQTASVTRNEHE